PHPVDHSTNVIVSDVADHHEDDVVDDERHDALRKIGHRPCRSLARTLRLQEDFKVARTRNLINGTQSSRIGRIPPNVGKNPPNHIARTARPDVPTRSRQFLFTLNSYSEDHT